MKSFLQLLRRPFKTFLGILLSLLACMVICVCMGQYIASVQTRAYVEDNYVSVGLLTSKYMKEEVFDEHGNSVGMTYYDQQPMIVQEFLQELTSPEYASIVEGVQQNSLTSGYISGLTPLNYYGIKANPIRLDTDATNNLSVAPYTYAMFEIEVDEVGEVRPFINYQPHFPIDVSAYGYAIDLTGTISRVCSLQAGYSDPTGRIIRLTMRFVTEEEASEARPQPGESYLVCGTDYDDLDARVCLSIAEFLGVEPSEVDWNNIDWYTEEEIAQSQLDVVGEYLRENGKHLSISESEAQMINSCSLTVCNNPLLYRGYIGQTEIQLSTGAISAEDYAAMFRDSGFVRLDGSAGDFLNKTTDPFWSEWLNTAQVNDRSFPILTVDGLNAVSQFATQDAFLVDGRGFTRQEASDGARVCVISASLAMTNGLGIGDKITIRFYETDMDIIPNQTGTKLANPSASYYSKLKGFVSNAEVFEIVGLYSQKNQWEQGTYCFTPNTVFVPKSAVSAGTTEICGGIYTSVVLKNGTISQMEQLASEHGFDGLFAFYDQGYSEIMASLQGYYEVENVVLRTGFVLWGGIVLLFLLLFPFQLRPDLKRMWELGTPPAKIRRHIFAGSAGMLLPGAVLGFIAAVLLFDRMAQHLANIAESDLSLTISTGTLGLIAAAQLFAALIIVYTFARILTACVNKCSRRE
ncbi:MAG: ABC transporter permease [Clostridiales bacterium]|nr:ABC transporter permease [Clostridiales bacterium]MDD7688127.1 ABC transporter permease [Clostridiales bacterium]MDY2597770.1 ABC transporter permease [Eubacteriales bacterium]MDY4622824.1 ABC transporter permease [Eubacteriales bacterium]